MATSTRGAPAARRPTRRFRRPAAGLHASTRTWLYIAGCCAVRCSLHRTDRTRRYNPDCTRLPCLSSLSASSHTFYRPFTEGFVQSNLLGVSAPLKLPRTSSTHALLWLGPVGLRWHPCNFACGLTLKQKMGAHASYLLAVCGRGPCHSPRFCAIFHPHIPPRNVSNPPHRRPPLAHSHL